MKRTKSTRSVARWLLVSTLICGSAVVVTSCGENTLEEILGAVDNPSVPVTNVTLNKASLKFYANSTESVLLTATVYPDNATDQSVTWSSSDETKATVDKTGKVTAVATGTATITAKAGDKTVTCEVYVYTKKHNINTDGDADVPAGEFWLIEGTGESVAKSITIGDGAMITLDGINITKQIACSGDATIILADGSENTVDMTASNVAAGIKVGGIDKTLTIRGEPADDGKLTAKGGSVGAGIGSDFNTSCGHIVIEGGDITATGYINGAGIGTGYIFDDGGATIQCGDITIRGGKVEATGGGSAAGIGTGNIYSLSGYPHNICGAIIISGGSVKANSNGGAAIGSSNGSSFRAECGNITISGGVVEASGSTGIGSGTNGECGNITISGGVVKASGSSYSYSGAGIGSGYNGECGNITISGSDTKVTAIGGSHSAGIGCGKVDSYTNNSECGNITISGGIVEATGGVCGAGIGTGSAEYGTSLCGAITITSGVTSVTATKGAYSPNSIGIGYTSNGGTQICGAITFGTDPVFDGTAATGTWIHDPMVADTYGGLKLAITTTTNDDDTWTLTPAP